MSITSQLELVLDRIDADLDNSLDRLFALLRIQSISTDPAYAPHCRAAAEHVAVKSSENLSPKGIKVPLWKREISGGYFKSPLPPFFKGRLKNRGLKSHSNYEVSH